MDNSQEKKAHLTPGERKEMKETMLNASGAKIEVEKNQPDAKIPVAKRQKRARPVLQGKMKEMVTGIRISCMMETNKGRPQYKTTEIPADDAVFLQWPVTEISQRIGIPIIAYEAPDRLH